MDSQGIIFELQWKKKHGIANREEDIANLGIWDTADSASSLNWMTFQSYLCQNLGTRDAISVAYVDSEGDELPIESECEFQEALKFARQRARRSRKIVLKVDKKDTSSASSKVDVEDKHIFAKLAKSGKEPVKEKATSIDNQFKMFKQAVTGELKDLQKSNKLLTEKLESMTKLGGPAHKRMHAEDEVPLWFKKYMQKMKRQIVEEVNASTRQMISNMSIHPPLPAVKTEPIETPTMKKRSSDEDSSDAALGSDQRDHKLLRKIEKLHKREKKLEKKLDSKLEKLESKTKRMMEKKSQCKSRPEWEWERVPEKKSTRKRLNDSQVDLMDAIVLNAGPKAEIHIKLGKRFTKIWEIMNNGTLPWTDKTELRLAWGTLGLEPEEPVVKCPILEPGEKGQIAVNFRAPDFPGTFEVYWHFYHMGQRFGHWVGCAVVVEEDLNIGFANADGINLTTSKKYYLGAVHKSGSEKEEEQGNFEKLDNVDSEGATSGIQRCEDAPASQNLNNIQLEANIRADVAIDLSNKSKCDAASNASSDHPNNNNINASSMPPPTSGPGCAAKPRDPEYDSDSDDDNLSIISAGGGVSSSSDSDDEKFVMVPMPACFLRDLPLRPVDVAVGADAAVVPEKRDAVTEVIAGSRFTAVDISAASAEPPEACGLVASAPPSDAPTSRFTVISDTDASARLSETNARPTAAKAGAVEQGAPSPFVIDLEEEGEYSSITSHDGGERWWDSEDFKSNVYAVDADGTCVPLETAWPIDEATKIRLGCAAKNRCTSPKSSQPEPESQESTRPGSRPEAQPHQNTCHSGSSFKTNHFHSSAFVNGRQIFRQSGTFDKDTHTFSNPRQPFSQSYEFGSTAPPPNCFNGAYNTSTVPPQPKKTAAPSQAKKTPAASPPKASRTENVTSHSYSTSQSASSTSSRGNDGSVHILPETIVNGAINVASSAYSTARALISNLGAIPTSGNEKRGSEERSGVMTNAECLKLLVDMGFRNHKVNVLLLQRYDNDIAKVVAELLRGAQQAAR